MYFKKYIEIQFFYILRKKSVISLKENLIVCLGIKPLHCASLYEVSLWLYSRSIVHDCSGHCPSLQQKNLSRSSQLKIYSPGLIHFMSLPLRKIVFLRQLPFLGSASDSQELELHFTHCFGKKVSRRIGNIPIQFVCSVMIFITIFKTNIGELTHAYKQCCGIRVYISGGHHFGCYCLDYKPLLKQSDIIYRKLSDRK